MSTTPTPAQPLITSPAEAVTVPPGSPVAVWGTAAAGAPVQVRATWPGSDGSTVRATLATVTADPFGRVAVTVTVERTVGLYLRAGQPGQYAYSPTVQVTAKAVEPAPARPRLIKHGQDIPSPAFVRANIGAMDRMPFDGVVVRTELSSRVMRATPTSGAQHRAALAPLAGLPAVNLKHNMVMVYATPLRGDSGGLYFDDEAWATVTQNWSRLAAAARDVGLAGIMYDNEEYFGSMSDHPGDCSGRSLAECQAKARERGRQVMDAVRAAWPSARVLVLHGGYVGHSPAYARLNGECRVPANDIGWANDLKGPFFVGMVASTVGSQARVVDGGEFYSERTEAQFRCGNDVQKRTVAQAPYVPDDLRATYPGAVAASSGVYDLPWPPGAGLTMDARIWGETIRNALRADEEYTWAYTEGYDWWGVGHPATRMPQSWVDATRAARQ